MKNMKLFKKQKVGKHHIKNLRKKILLSINDLLILQCIKKNPIGGQEIMNKIQYQFGVKISPGIMYCILFSLKKRNLVYTKIDKKRKLHFLTKKGEITSKALLKDHVNIQKKMGFFEVKKK